MAKREAEEALTRKKLKLLFVVPPEHRPSKTSKDSTNEQELYNIYPLLDSIKPTLDKYVESYDIVTSMEEYEALPDQKKSSYDVVLP